MKRILTNGTISALIILKKSKFFSFCNYLYANDLYLSVSYRSDGKISFFYWLNI
jgi:hypothetical protein